MLGVLVCPGGQAYDSSGPGAVPKMMLAAVRLHFVTVSALAAVLAETAPRRTPIVIIAAVAGTQNFSFLSRFINFLPCCERNNVYNFTSSFSQTDSAPAWSSGFNRNARGSRQYAVGQFAVCIRDRFSLRQMRRQARINAIYSTFRLSRPRVVHPAYLGFV